MRKLRLADPAVWDRIFRMVSLTFMLVAVGACVVLMLTFVLKVTVLLVALSGVLSMALAFYLFVRLWPNEEVGPPAVSQAVARAMEEVRKREPLSPEEYRRQRARAQKMIRDKAAPALAKAIRGLLRQDEISRRKKR